MIEAVPEAFKVTVWLPFPSEYVTIAFGVPVKFIVLVVFEQMLVGLAIIDAVGIAAGDTVIDCESGFVQPFGTESVTLTSV